jgi:hypothetical protein
MVSPCEQARFQEDTTTDWKLEGAKRVTLSKRLDMRLSMCRSSMIIGVLASSASGLRMVKLDEAASLLADSHGLRGTVNASVIVGRPSLGQSCAL